MLGTVLWVVGLYRLQNTLAMGQRAITLCIFLFGSLQVLKYSQLLEAVDIAGALDFCRERDFAGRSQRHFLARIKQANCQATVVKRG